LKTRILITDGLGKEGVDLLKTHPEFEVVLRTATSPKELLELTPEFDAVIARTTTKITEEVIAKASRLKLIVAPSAGYDHIDVVAARDRNVLVLNCPTGNSLAAAEHTLGLMFSLARSIPQSFASVRAGNWERGPSFVGTELHGKVLGIIGLGNIGKIVAEKAMALGMLVIAYDTAISTVDVLPSKFKYLEMRFKLAKNQDEVLAEADWVTIHIPKEERNIGLFSGESISKMRKGAFLVNASRGGIVHESALLEALTSGHLAGAAVDVLEHEPPHFDEAPLKDLLLHPRFIATAHLGGATGEAKERIAAQAAQQVLAFFNEGARTGIQN
jgi:D-3-phosphoglycerate dehydrogenase / 2-oxoglutarate reductase